MWALLILLSATASAQQPLNCSAYACAPPGKELTGGACAIAEGDNFWMSLCPNFNEVIGCDFNDEIGKSSTCGDISPAQPEPAYPGEPCDTKNDCISNSTAHCTEGMCVGLSSDEACAEDYECDVGLFCNITKGEASGKCAYQTFENSVCLRDEDCMNNFGCTGYIDAEGEHFGTCITYYSLPLNSTVNMCLPADGEGINQLCEFGVCRQTGSLELPGPGVCIKGYVSNAPKKCRLDSDCIGTSSSNFTTMKTCQCGYSSSGQPFCPIFSGDAIAVDVMVFTQTLLETNLSDCHTSRRFSDFCFERYLDSTSFKSYLGAKEVATNFFAYQENDNCVRANILNDFYDLTADSFSCPAYGCGMLTNTSLCAIYNQGNNTYELAACSIGNMCPVQNLGYSNVSCQAQVTPPGSAYPGEPCQAASDCNTNKCNSGTCVGIQQGQNCTDSTVCSPGLYCSITSQCDTLLKPGSSCLTDSDCQLNAGCNVIQNFFNCTLYFSLANGDSVYCAGSGSQQLCGSGWCQEIQNDVGICVPAPASAYSLPMLCESDDDCIDTTHNFTTKCKCGYNLNSQKFCHLFPGDAPYANYLNNMKKMLLDTNTANGICQTTRRFTPQCINLTIAESNSNDFTLLSQFYNATMYPQLQDNDACVQALFTSAYWSIHTNSTPGPGPEPSYAATVAVAAGLLWLSILE